jgi:hypothetical protein
MSADSAHLPSVTWSDFAGGLVDLVKYERPTFYSADAATRQLIYVEKFALGLGAKSVAVEERYVDRDFVDDHSAYYSKSLQPYTGFCHRVHFFSTTAEATRQGMRELVGNCLSKEDDHYRSACRQFSNEYYLGFCVVRPLPGSPVGRTVLKPPHAANSEIVMTGVRRYAAHFLGVELTVRGLAFQQQDLGVSAWATTAIWSSLQKMQDFEDIASFTPAAITTLASRYSLAHGRMMPAEAGLNIDQMCQAIQGVGAAPSLIAVKDLADARRYLHAAIRSGFAPILVSQGSSGEWHAVASVGIELKGNGEEESMPKERKALPVSSQVKAVYLHDDRIGPYVRAELAQKPDDATNSAYYLLASNELAPAQASLWHLRYLLVPTHAKLRLSFNGLLRVADSVLGLTHAFWEAQVEARSQLSQVPSTIKYELYATRLYRYVESLVLEGPGDIISSLSELVTLPRYVGVVSLAAAFTDRINLLVDTTDTFRNVKCLAVVARGNKSQFTQRLVARLADHYRCWPVTPPHAG